MKKATGSFQCSPSTPSKKTSNSQPSTPNKGSNSKKTTERSQLLKTMKISNLESREISSLRAQKCSNKKRKWTILALGCITIRPMTTKATMREMTVVGWRSNFPRETVKIWETQLATMMHSLIKRERPIWPGLRTATPIMKLFQRGEESTSIQEMSCQLETKTFQNNTILTIKSLLWKRTTKTTFNSSHFITCQVRELALYLHLGNRTTSTPELVPKAQANHQEVHIRCTMLLLQTLEEEVECA